MNLRPLAKIADKAISASPENSQYYSNLAHVQFRLSDFNNAIINFKKAISLSPTCGDYYCGIGEVYNALNDSQNALDNLIHGCFLLKKDSVKVNNSWVEGYLAVEVAYGNIFKGLFTKMGIHSQQARDKYIADKEAVFKT